MDSIVVNQVCDEPRGILPTLSAYFADFGSTILGESDEISASVGRDRRIGLGQYGPSEAVQDFAINLGNLLLHLAGECDDTATNIRAVYACFMQADAEAVAALDAITSKLTTAADTWGGAPYQTWEYHTHDLRRLADGHGEAAPQYRRRGRS